MNRLLSEDSFHTLMAQKDTLSVDFHYDPEKHRLEFLCADLAHPFFLRLPIHYHMCPEEDMDMGLDLPAHRYLMLLIQTEGCAMAYCEDEDIIAHKTYKTYAVRKKQGKSQIKYLNTKGKSKAGSRLRLSNTVMFFEHINERLQSYFEEYEIDRIALSCSKTLIPYLFGAKVACPFTKKDRRIYKIPKHLPLPTFETLQQTQQFLLSAELIYEKEDTDFIRERLSLPL